MVAFVDALAMGEEIPKRLREILMAPIIKNGNNFDGIIFSGGIAEYLYKDIQDKNGDFEFEDIGKFLAIAFKKSKLYQNYNVIEPVEAIRATVVGAGDTNGKCKWKHCFHRCLYVTA